MSVINLPEAISGQAVTPQQAPREYHNQSGVTIPANTAVELDVAVGLTSIKAATAGTTLCVGVTVAAIEDDASGIVAGPGQIVDAQIDAGGCTAGNPLEVGAGNALTAAAVTYDTFCAVAVETRVGAGLAQVLIK